MSVMAEVSFCFSIAYRASRIPWRTSAEYACCVTLFFWQMHPVRQISTRESMRESIVKSAVMAEPDEWLEVRETWCALE